MLKVFVRKNQSGSRYVCVFSMSNNDFVEIEQHNDEYSSLMESADVEMNKRSSVTSIINHRRHRYPHCIVWTPIPLITYEIYFDVFLRNTFIYRWLFPFVGHMGIATSSGIIRDFSGSYSVTVSSIYYKAGNFGWY